MTNKWSLRGVQLVKSLRIAKTEAAIKELCLPIIEEIRSSYKDKPESWKRPLAEVRKAVLQAFPYTPEQQSPLQYFTNTGKGNIPRYQHLALKYLTFSSNEWDMLGDNARSEWKLEQEWINQSAENQTNEMVVTTTVPVEEPEIQTEIQQPQLKLKDMKIEQLELDDETQQTVLEAIALSTLDLAQFIQQACKVYAKTVTAKAKRHTEDLAGVPTQKLLDDKSYMTHPLRAEELTRRCIQAMMMHNESVPETSDRWCITQTAIAYLTGSKAASVGKTLEKYQTMINDHNLNYELNNYSNRKRGRDIFDEISIAQLVPDGIDL